MKGLMGVRALAAAPLVALVCFAIPASGAGAAAPGMRFMAPTPLTPRGATQLGPVSPSATVSGALVLQPRDEDALTRFISQVTDKRSMLFHHYLAPGEFASRFGPTHASIAAVESQLRADGLTVTGVEPDGMIVQFSGQASQVESSFGTGLERYKLANGSTGRARTSPLRVPATIAQDVAAVVGLDTTVRLRPSSAMQAPSAGPGGHRAAKPADFIHPAGSPAPCSDATTIAQQYGGLTDDQIANAYGAFGLYNAGDTGAGQHIAVFELEPFSPSDLQTFDTCYFGAGAAAAMASRLQVIPVDGGQAAGPGGGESILDIQDVSAFAPGANIDVYEAPNNVAGSVDAYAKIVNDDVDQVVTTSWGLCEQDLQQGAPGVQQAENLLFQQAAAQGQSVFAAAGDEGSDDCNALRMTTPVSPILSVDDPGSQPYVVAAGGTTIDDPTQPALEHVWNDGPSYGAGGGGISESWPMPAWQLNSEVPGVNNAQAVNAADTFENADLGDAPGTYKFCGSDSNAGAVEVACREVPDVSADADEFTGAVTVYSAALGGWNTVGGTSSAAPMWAAMLADVNASPTCQSNPATHSGVGFVDPELYAVASSPAAYAASFNDITAGNNDPFGDSTLFQATAGYDMASGLGTPQLTQPGGGAGLAFYLCSLAASGTRPSVTGISPAIGLTSAAATSVTISGTNFERSGTADVKGVEVGGYQVPASDFAVTGPGTITATFPAADLVIPPNDQTDGAGRVQVVVTLDDGESSAPNVNSAFTYVDDNGSSHALPTVTGVHTSAGPDAGGNIVDVYGAGFTGATGVAFGGVAAAAFTVLHDWEIQVTVPGFVGGTTVCDQDGSFFSASENASNDICQTQVIVTTPSGSSHTSTIKPLYEGVFAVGDNGVVPVPSLEEASPAATEYDYLPGPTITSISTNNGPSSLASEGGGTVVTIQGKGFNLAALDWVNFGDPTQESSEQFALVSVTGTKIQVQAPPLDSTTLGPTTLPVTVSTLAGLSNSTNATYAGIPSVTGVKATSGPTAGEPAGPDTGGTPIAITGSGFAGQAFVVVFDDIGSQYSYGTQYNLSATSDTAIGTTTVPQNPGVVDVQVCTTTDCSAPTSFNGDSSDVFFLYPPGDPKIDSITPDSAPANGGTQVTITGQNLGCVDSVFFGDTEAEDASNAQALLDCGSTTTVTLTLPPGKVGTVPVTLSTVESDVTHASPATASFTYTKAPAQTLTVHRSGRGTGKVTSAPKGISCGKTCSHKFAYGKSVALKARAATGSIFAGWSGACSGTRTCKIAVTGTTSVKATFTLARCVVPNVKGKTLATAKRELRAHACSAGKVTHAFSRRVKKGRVISQKPRPKRHLKHGSKVSLVISKGG